MSHVALGRDDFLRHVFDPDFFAENPALIAAQEEITACRAAYMESANKSTCRCGGNPRLVFACLDNLLELLEQLRTTDPAAITQLVHYVGRKRNTAATSVTLYYRKTAQIPLRKIRFA